MEQVIVMNKISMMHMFVAGVRGKFEQVVTLAMAFLMSQLN